MKIVAIQSSANTDGLTSACAEEVLKGTRAQGAETELIHLNEMSVFSCMACDSGWGHHYDEKGEHEPDECILEDDFANLREKVAKADGLVFATPVYFWDLSESAKVFLDRLRRTHYPIESSPFIEKPTIGIAAAGGTGNGAAEATTILDRYLVKWLEMKRIATFPVTRMTQDLHLQTSYEAGVLMAETISYE